MSRSLNDLHPEVRWRAEKLLQSAQEIHVPILIYFTLRTFAEQDKLYEQGRSQPGRVVTQAKAGQSYHNYGLAFDFVPKDQNGQPTWEDLNGFNSVGEQGEALGLQWGGRWPKKDRPHLQMSFGFPWTELLKFYLRGGLAEVWEEIDKKVEARAWP